MMVDREEPGSKHLIKHWNDFEIKMEKTKERKTLGKFITKYHESWKECGCGLCLKRRYNNDLIYKMLIDLKQKKLVNKLKKEEHTRWIDDELCTLSEKEKEEQRRIAESLMLRNLEDWKKIKDEIEELKND